MKSKPPKRALGAKFIPLLILFTACSLLPWLKTENRAYKKMKEKGLADQEVVIIDGEEYVKVAGGEGSRSRYIPVDEYLSKRGEFSSSEGQEGPGVERLPQSAKESGDQPHALSTTASSESAGTPSSSSIRLRRKIIVAPFEDEEPDEDWGEMAARRLRDSMESRTDTILCLDDKVVVEYLEKRGIGSSRLDDPMVLRIANTVFGVHAILYGTLSGPYISASTGRGGDGEDTALAIVRIQARLVETATGRVLKAFERSNPIFATEERGKFSRDKAELKAVHLTIGEVTGDIVNGINQMGWYTRIVKIDGDRVYLNAGRLTGLRVGDLMDVFGPGRGQIDQTVGFSMDPFAGQRKGQIRVSQLFGTDAAIAQITLGGDFIPSDVARPSMH
jgi:hypothetical protein